MPHSSPYSKRFTESLLRNSFKGIAPKNNQLFRYNTKMYFTDLTLLQRKQQVTYYLFTVVPFAVVFILFVMVIYYVTAVLCKVLFVTRPNKIVPF